MLLEVDLYVFLYIVCLVEEYIKTTVGLTMEKLIEMVIQMTIEMMTMKMMKRIDTAGCNDDIMLRWMEEKVHWLETKNTDE